MSTEAGDGPFNWASSSRTRRITQSKILFSRFDGVVTIQLQSVQIGASSPHPSKFGHLLFRLIPILAKVARFSTRARREAAMRILQGVNVIRHLINCQRALPLRSRQVPNDNREGLGRSRVRSLTGPS